MRYKNGSLLLKDGTEFGFRSHIDSLIKHTIQVKGKPVKLTPKAFDLLGPLRKRQLVVK